ncbi:MAG: hypothetical protein ABSG05_00120 [Candidatus Pacearchaeota archaeon]|jgi:hypothetical protein
MTLSLRLDFDHVDFSGISFERGYDINDFVRKYGSRLDSLDDSHIIPEEISDFEYWNNYIDS